MLPAWLRNGPHVKLPKTRTTGFGPISFERVISSLPSTVLSVKSGAGSPSAGPGWSEPISWRKRPRTRVSFDGPASLPEGPRRPVDGMGTRLLEVGERQEAVAVAVGLREEGVELLAGDLAVAVAVGPLEDHRAGRGGQGVRREVEVGARSARRRGRGRGGRSRRRRRGIPPARPGRRRRGRTACGSRPSRSGSGPRPCGTSRRSGPSWLPWRMSVNMSSHSGRSGHASASARAAASGGTSPGAAAGLGGSSARVVPGAAAQVSQEAARSSPRPDRRIFMGLISEESGVRSAVEGPSIPRVSARPTGRGPPGPWRCSSRRRRSRARAGAGTRSRSGPCNDSGRRSARRPRPARGRSRA